MSVPAITDFLERQTQNVKEFEIIIGGKANLIQYPLLQQQFLQVLPWATRHTQTSPSPLPPHPTPPTKQGGLCANSLTTPPTPLNSPDRDTSPSPKSTTPFLGSKTPAWSLTWTLWALLPPSACLDLHGTPRPAAAGATAAGAAPLCCGRHLGVSPYGSPVFSGSPEIRGWSLKRQGTSWRPLIPPGCPDNSRT